MKGIVLKITFNKAKHYAVVVSVDEAADSYTVRFPTFLNNAVTVYETVVKRADTRRVSWPQDSVSFELLRQLVGVPYDVKHTSLVSFKKLVKKEPTGVAPKLTNNPGDTFEF